MLLQLQRVIIPIHSVLVSAPSTILVIPGHVKERLLFEIGCALSLKIIPVGPEAHKDIREMNHLMNLLIISSPRIPSTLS